MQSNFETRSTVTTNETVERKIKALRIRQRIESLATSQWAVFTGKDFDTLSHSHVALRLHLLVGRVPVDEQHKVLGTVIALAHAYGTTSDMIHGRSKSARVQRIQFDEWETLLACAEDVAVSFSDSKPGGKES